MNRVVLMGRLVKDPELKKTQGDVPVCSFAVAVDRKFQKEGANKEVDYIDCVAWRQKADVLSKYFKKGSRILIEGSIQKRSWKKQDGTTGYATEVVVDDIEFCESKQQEPGWVGETRKQVEAAKPEADTSHELPFDL